MSKHLPHVAPHGKKGSAWEQVTTECKVRIDDTLNVKKLQDHFKKLTREYSSMSKAKHRRTGVGASALSIQQLEDEMTRLNDRINEHGMKKGRLVSFPF